MLVLIIMLYVTCVWTKGTMVFRKK